MTLPKPIKRVLNDYSEYGITGKIELEFYQGDLRICRPKLSGYEVDRVERMGERLSFLPGGAK
jgi:hypothetical protein